MEKGFLAILAVCGSGLALNEAAAQTGLIIPEVEVIGSEENLEHIPGSGQIIDAETLEASRPFTVNEALRKAVGVNVRDEDGFGLRPNIGIRGLNPTRSTKTLLLEDGLPLAYAPYGDNASYFHPQIEKYERIEVLKGAGQILFGPQTIGGTINYITPRPPQEFGGHVALAGGNRDFFSGNVRLGGRGVLFDAIRKQGDGARDNIYTQLNDVNLKGVIQLTGSQAVTLRANYYDEDSRVTYSGVTEAELRNFGERYNPFGNDRFDANRYGASATHEIVFGENTSLITSVYGSYFSRDWWRQASTTTDGQCGAAFTAARLAGAAVNPDLCNSIQGRLRDYTTYGVEPRLSVRHGVFGVPSELDAGVKAHFEIQKRRQENGLSPSARDGAVVESNRRETDAYSAFVQNRLLFGRFTVSPGVRVEHVRSERTNRLTDVTGDDDLTEIIPALGGTFEAVPGTIVFAGIHKGFAPPRTEDVIDGVGTSTEVDAEESWNYEAGVRSAIGRRANVAATLFRNDFDNLISVGQIAGGNTPLAEGEALIEGLELSGQIESETISALGGRAFFDVAYTHLFTAESTTLFRQVATGAIVAGSASGNDLPYAPENLLTASVGFIHRSGWDMRLEAVYIDDQFSDFANTRNAPVDGNGQIGIIPNYTILNAAINYRLKPYRTTLFLTAKNLGDRDHIVDRTRGIATGIPRLVYGGLKFDFD